jgi:acetyl-CoA acetyltransferase family protein
MGETAERVAVEQCGVTREAQDQLRAALASQRRGRARLGPPGPGDRRDRHRHRQEGQPPRGGGRRAPARRHHPRQPGQAAPGLRKDGTVTAGNASGLNDGAAAVLLASEAAIAELGLTPQARYVTAAVAGVEPSVMGLGPDPGLDQGPGPRRLDRASIDVAELNEAFAAQAVPCIAELGLDPERVNVNGGAIALGHPLGASGARLVATLVHRMRREGHRRGLASLCIGVGQGIATVFERA